MEVTLKVKRFNPESESKEPYFQEYNLEVEDYVTVLDALIKVREEVDGSLALRCSCRAAICGSCSMRVNGHAKLACNTKIVDVAPKDHNVTVEPMGNLPVVKDLVTDMKPFWDRVKAVQPWLQPQGPEPEEEYIAPGEDMLHLTGVMSCIMCGACASDCTVLEVDRNFLGPAALAKAYRFVGDPRDDANKERLGKYSQYGGIWDCTRCMECVQVCPKGVAPMERIMSLRDKAMEAGFTNNNGARHTDAFSDLVKHSGRLDELKLPLRTYGVFNVTAMIGLSMVGLRAFLRGKTPPIIHKAIPGKDKVRRLFEKVEGK